ncbi:MAG TPA: hypothetical protein VGK48_27820, partial [Terriglobia bacterium]
PRHITAANKLTPGTWIVAEASGSLAVNLAASLGYNFNFVKDVQAFGLSGDIGLKIDAAATATFGINVSGRYLVVVGRESDLVADQHLRLRLFKLDSNGLQFGLNLKLGVTGVETVTLGQVDDFVQAVFGVHGAQIVTALQQIQKWTDPTKSVGQLVAGLVNDKALQIIKDTTGIDPQTAFDTARSKFLDAVNLYQSLPGKVSSELLGFINDLTPSASADLQNALTALTQTDPNAQKQALLSLFNASGITSSPIGKLLSGLAENGLLSLVDRLPEVRGMAATIQSILNGGVIARLESFIDDKLGLDKVLAAVSQNDFSGLDSFLVGRLSTFFDRTLGFADLNDIKNAINLVISKRQDIYAAATKALNSTYGLSLAAAWQRTSTSTAVIDAVFDMSDASAKQLFANVVTVSNSGLDQLLTTTLPSVNLNAGVLSHELTTKSTLDISLPHFNFQTQNVTTSLAKVTAENDGGRLLVYDATGSNAVSVTNKFNSSLAVTIAAAVARTGTGSPDLRIHSTDGASWSYELLYAKAGMKREELEAITRPFLTQYMAAQFSQGTSLSSFYSQLEDTVSQILQNPPETFGDVCASFEVTIPGDALASWVQPVKNVLAAAKAVSIAIQTSLKKNVEFFYLSDISNLANLASSAPLLAWSSIPPAVSFDGSNFSDAAGKDVYWDQEDIQLRRAAAANPNTIANLSAKLAGYRLRLEEAGLHSSVQFYADNQAGTICQGATTQFGDILFLSLLTFEAEIVDKAQDALQDIQKFLALAGTSPSQAVTRLAQFAADITTTFNQLLGQNVFVDIASFRAVGQVVFSEASRALNPVAAGQPVAMLTLDVLSKSTSFQIPAFFTGSIPQASDVAVAQRLVNI